MEQKPQTQTVLSVKNLTKRYGNREAISNLTFSIQAGEIFGFLGANGAGKSTTMKILTGLANASMGEVYVCGKNLSKDFEKAIKNVGGMVETPQFYPYLTGYQNLKFYASLYPDIPPKRILDIATLVGLSLRLNDKVKNYSLGMKQRLGIAQALLHNPKLLILDEPTNGLDASGIREVKTFLKTIAQKSGTAIMISSHILAIMENICDRVCVIDKGKIVEIKTMEEIKQKYHKGATHYIKTNSPNYAGMILQNQFKIKCGIKNGDLVLKTTNNDLARIIVHLTSYRIPIFGAGEIDYSLEEIFINIVGDNNSIK